MPSTQITVFATLTATPGQESALRAVLAALAGESRKEPGNIAYLLHEAIANPAEFHVYEIYASQAALDAHMASPHLQAALGAAGPLLGAAPVITPTTVVA